MGVPPVVSIITPAYDAAPFLEETLRSVAAQTFPDWGMIVVDEASRDATREIVERWAASDPRLRLVPQTHRQGARAAPPPRHPDGAAPPPGLFPSEARC